MSPMHEIVWMVSFKIEENGDFSDYMVDKVDLANYRNHTAERLRAKMGKGIFHNVEEAEEWAKTQMARCNCECKCGK